MNTDKPLPDKWGWTTLAQVCDKIQDGTHFSPKNQLPHGKYRYITAKNVKPAGLDLSEITFLTEADHREINQRCDPRPGDVLLVKDGVNTGDAAINTIDEEISLLSSVCFLRPSAGLVNRYLRYYLLSPMGYNSLVGRMTGTAIKRIILKKIKETRIPIPPLAEQRRIVAKVEELFSELDAGVAVLEKVRAKLKRYRASVLKAAVEGRLTEGWRAEHPPAEPAPALLARILADRRRWWEEAQKEKFATAGKPPPKDWQAKYAEPTPLDTTSLPALPNGWCWVTLDALAEVVGGITKGQKRSSGGRVREVPYLRVANVQRGYLDLEEIKVIEAADEEIEALKLQPGDILFNEGGDRDKLGRGWVWRGEIDECIHQNHVFRARLCTADVLPEWVSHHGNTFGRYWFMRAGKQSVNLASINLTVLKNFPVPLAPVSEQQAILEDVERRLTVVDQLAAQVEANLTRAARLRQAILKRAFEGKLVPQDPADEPAMALLARLQRPTGPNEERTGGTERASIRKRRATP